MAADILLMMDAYTEYSPSGQGLRILFLATGFQYDKAKYYIKNDAIGLEIYIAGNTSRFVTLTGNTLTPGVDLEERGEQLAAVLEKYMARPAGSTPSVAPSGPAGEAGSPDDLALIERAKRGRSGEKFTALWAGDLSGYSSRSEADMALCNALAWWTNKDAARMDRLFRQSGLMREKWDRQQSGSTYGAITIQNAVRTCAGGYDPQENRQRESPQAWELPVPFAHIDTPDFPVESLPGAVGAFVEQLAESTQTPEEMGGILSLGILATAFQSKYEVEITPDWREPLCLYPVAVAPPGERKSAVIAALSAPVYEYEKIRREFEAAEIAQNKTERALLEKALQAAQSRAVKGKGGFASAREEALALSAQLANFKERHPFRLLVDDTTPEKLVDMMELQGGCITVASAEGGVFDSIAGRYDRAANFDIYLKGHSGDPISVDRIGRKSNHIAKPRLTMMLTIQPSVLHGLMDNATFRGRGLCGRFLYAVCKSKVGRRKVSPDPISSGTREDYRQFVRRILADQGSGTVHLSAAADAIRKDYQAYIEKKLGGEWEHMRDWAGKLVGAMARIAALLHLSSFPVDVPVSAETMAAATGIAEFLGAHAEAAYQAMGADESMEGAKYLWQRISDKGDPEISKRDLYNACKGKFKRVEQMDPALHTLIEMGYVRVVDVSTGGRPTQKIKVNPIAQK
ncbi:DUF3987 domain-containing protein [uncultured Intestinimonas sp.]|uniref:phage NrS-1 polymerase family protein n=1 Tax=uncultured Intestinimonas sp. TaxID=1689265 RepID=UPI0025EABA88|nr:DUF3987 domain-containing protein [uncultured Intestinimonas sp.]